MSARALAATLRVLTVVLILRVLASILANYPDYFPPNFDSLFLEGREATLGGGYRVAFYAHILSAPVVLAGGLILLSESVRRRWPRWHRVLGRLHVALLLGVMLPSGALMSRHAFAGWPAGLSFLLLSLATAGCAVLGVASARAGRYDSHRRWMVRCYALVCSAVVLRLVSGAASAAGVTDAETAYAVAAWASWLGPLAVTEAVLRGRAAP